MDNRRGSHEQLSLMFDAPAQPSPCPSPCKSNVVVLGGEVVRSRGQVLVDISRMNNSAPNEESAIIRRVISEAERLGW